MKRFLYIFFLFSVSIFADQFAYIGEDLAQRAVKLLSSHKEVYLLCEPCGQKTGEFRSFSTARVKAVEIPAEINPESETYSEVYIDNLALDLAYVYVHVNNQWKNLAIELGEKPTGVSDTIKIETEMYKESNEYDN